MDYSIPTQGKPFSFGIIILLVFFILLILGGTYAGYYYYKQGFFNDEENKAEPPKAMFYVKALDYVTGEEIPLKYELFEGQNIEECLNEDMFKLYKEKPEEFYDLMPAVFGKQINERGCFVKKLVFTKNTEGNLYEGLNLITINNMIPNLFYYYSKDYYVNKELWITGFMSQVNVSQDIYDTTQKAPKNTTITSVYAHKKSNYVDISLLGEITSNNSTIIRVQLKGEPLQFRRVNLCFKHSLGVISITGAYEQIVPPRRLVEANSCYRLGESLSNSNEYSLQRDFLITTLRLDETDSITIYAFDEELTYDGAEWSYKPEDSLGRDIGAKDFSKEFKVFK